MAITVDVTPNNTTVSPEESVTTTLDITTSIPTISAFLPLLSINDAGGDGSLAYNNSNGEFTYTGPSASEVRAHFSAGTGVTYSSGEFSIGQDVATSATPTFAALTVDNVKIDGTTIGHTDDTDLITLASGQVTIAGSLNCGTSTITGGAFQGVNLSLTGGSISTSGVITGSSLDVNSASIAGAVTDVTTLTASGEIEGGSLDINGAVDIDTGGSAFNVNLGSATAVITTSGTNSCLSLESTASGSTNDAPELRLRRASVPSADDQTGSIRFQSQTTGGTTRTYGRILSQVKDPSNTDYKGTIFFEVQNATSSGGDSLKNVMELEPDDVKIGVGETTTNLTVNGTATATTFSGSGASLTNLPAAQLSGAIANGVTATTQSASDNSTKVATTAYTDTAIANLVNSAPSTLDTLGEIATALNNDAALNTTLTNSIATKLPLAGGQMTGNITFSSTQTVDGRDLSVDGAKLDGIEASATADQTAAEIRTLVESASDSNVFTDADHTKLNAIEASADVTDATNVTAAGALMDSELTDLAGIKSLDTSTLQVKPSEGAFANGDKTKLDGIEAGADVTDATNVTAAGALMDSEVTNLAQVKAFSASDYVAATGDTTIAGVKTFSGSISGHITTTVSDGDQPNLENFYGQRVIHTGDAHTYTLAATGSISGSAIGKNIIIVNAGTDTITCNFTTSKFYVMTSGNNADVGGSGASSFTILKGGIAEIVVTETDKALVFGSGI